jgi:hypothetical protein
MNLDTLVVFVLALLFFGGIVYLVWNERKKQNLKATKPVSPAEVDLQVVEVEPRKRRAR